MGKALANREQGEPETRRAEVDELGAVFGKIILLRTRHRGSGDNSSTSLLETLHNSNITVLGSFPEGLLLLVTEPGREGDDGTVDLAAKEVLR